MASAERKQPAARRGRMGERKGRWLGSLAWTAGLLAAWIALGGDTGVADLAAGAAFAGVAAALGRNLRGEQPRAPDRRLLPWRTAALLPVLVLRDLAPLGGALLRRLTGVGSPAELHWRSVPAALVRHGAVLRRAAAVAAVSALPDSFALGIDRQRKRMLVHELVPSGRELPL